MDNEPLFPSRFHVKDRVALNRFLDDLELKGAIQYPFTFNYLLQVDTQPNGNSKFKLITEYTDIHFKNGKTLQIAQESYDSNIKTLTQTHQTKLIRNGEVDDF